MFIFIFDEYGLFPYSHSTNIREYEFIRASLRYTRPPHDLDLPVGQQAHEPLAFLSGSFIGSSLRCSVVEKEGFSILVACNRLGWLLQTSAGFSLFTDHRNQFFIFDPFVSNPGLSSCTYSKLLRWATRLSQYCYTIEHVRGEEVYMC
jgi:hypothetical protein